MNSIIDILMAASFNILNEIFIKIEEAYKKVTDQHQFIEQTLGDGY